MVFYTGWLCCRSLTVDVWHPNSSMSCKNSPFWDISSLAMLIPSPSVGLLVYAMGHRLGSSCP